MTEGVGIRHASEATFLCKSRRHAWLVFALAVVFFSIPFGEFQRELLGGATAAKIVLPIVFLIFLSTNAYRLKIHPHLWILLLFILGTLPSLIIGDDFAPVLITLIGYIVLFEVLYNILVAVGDLRLLCTFYVSGLFMVVLSTLMAAIGFDIGQSIGHPLVEIWYGIPVFRGTELNPNGFATFFVPGCVMVGYFYLSAATRLSKILSLVALVFFGITLVMTGSRSGLMGAFLGLVIVYLNKRIFSLQGAGTFVVIIVIAAALTLAIPKLFHFLLIGDLELSTGPSMAADKETSTELRVAAIGHFIDAFISNPLIGIGYGKLVPYIDASSVGEKMGAHNVIIGIAVEMGVVALLPFLMMIMVSSICMAKALRRARGRGDSLIKGCYFGAFVGLLFHGMFHEIYVNLLFWFFMGVATMLTRVSIRVSSADNCNNICNE